MCEERETFVIDDDKKADWCIKKVLEARAERDRLVKLASEEMESLAQKVVEINKKCENETAYFLSALGQYFNTVEHKKTKTQESYQLLSGRLIMKTPKLTLEPDKEKLVDWCKKNANEYVKTSESVAWGELKKKITISGESAIFGDTGEIVDCIKLVESPAEFDVKG